MEALQQFVADQLLKLPQVAAVKPQSLDKFLARVPQHKVTALAFSSSSRASLPLRHAAQQHERHVVVGRVNWDAEVKPSYCPSCCTCVLMGHVGECMFGECVVQLRSLLFELRQMQNCEKDWRERGGGGGMGLGGGGQSQGRQTMYESCLQ